VELRQCVLHWRACRPHRPMGPCNSHGTPMGPWDFHGPTGIP
jgi:hypothetical protein